MAVHSFSARHLVSRIAAGTLGAYALAWGFAALVTVLGRSVGMAFGEAWSLATMLALLLLLVAFCWAFAAESLTRAWLVLAGGGAAMTLLAWLMTHGLST